MCSYSLGGGVNQSFFLFQNSMIPSGLSWEDLLHPLYQKYKNHITWGDQDLLNIIFHYNPGTLYHTTNTKIKWYIISPPFMLTARAVLRLASIYNVSPKHDSKGGCINVILYGIQYNSFRQVSLLVFLL